MKLEKDPESMSAAGAGEADQEAGKADEESGSRAEFRGGSRAA